ncbi:hypothetical protein PSYPI_47186, partial [Pseudomonas syringae pv. pisi str. 1704B]
QLNIGAVKCLRRRSGSITGMNTASQLEQGKVYWNIRFTDVPP